ncbi:hypothetical protein [uncultured Tateyamaria sp.]|uniref:hypothetical protein n=1 Tax=uncultured Tateyamaria sp. TaxID=455651 RepID=UPI00263258D0|nr:hypothetical protein [uncultured Tateyamaria sp.]
MVFGVLACVLIIHPINVTHFIGVQCAVANAISSIVTDVSAQWSVAIPFTAAAVIWFGLPFRWGFLATNAEEMTRLLMVHWRVTQFL